MTEDQAVSIVKRFKDTVDGGCTHCASQAVDCLAKEFPELNWIHIAELAVGSEYIRGILDEVELQSVRDILDN